MTKKCRGTDRAVAALIRDLKLRGLLDETLVVFSGEFGRTPFREGRTAKGNVLGRDHFPDVYSMLLCGGGIRNGLTYGESDELGFRVAANKVHVHDLQATILHQLGFDHERLSYRHQARDFRLLVRERLVAGDSDQEVLDFFVARYGDYVLLEPRFRLETTPLWLGPPIVLALALLGVFVWFRSSQRRVSTEVAPLTAAERERLDALVDELGRDNGPTPRGPPPDAKG